LFSLFSIKVAQDQKTISQFNYFPFELFLEENNLDGSIPDEVGALEELTSLDLDGNIVLSGTIPTTLGFLDSLRTLNMEQNSLTGELPDSLFASISLVRLDLDANKLDGDIPSLIGNLENLQILELGKCRNKPFQAENQVADSSHFLIQYTFLKDDNLLTGTLPSQIGLLEELGTFSFESRINVEYFFADN
jgi:Leucine-rich repeat (LRR) protein